VGGFKRTIPYRHSLAGKRIISHRIANSGIKLLSLQKKKSIQK
jgi:hypothetical protein